MSSWNLSDGYGEYGIGMSLGGPIVWETQKLGEIGESFSGPPKRQRQDARINRIVWK